MTVIRVPRKEWGRALMAMTAIAPIRVIGKDPLVEVLPAHLQLLADRGISYEIVPEIRRNSKRRHAASN
jgi:hypothetical protein